MKAPARIGTAIAIALACVTSMPCAEEEQNWERYEFLEHLVRMAKSKACLKLGIKTGSDA